MVHLKERFMLRAAQRTETTERARLSLRSIDAATISVQDRHDGHP